MRNSFRLGKIMGITISLHYSWFLIFAFFTFILSTSFLDNYHYWVRIMAGTGASLSLFLSVLSHELSHSFIAIRNGIPVKSITLFILGGVAHITKEATRPVTELKIAIAGPLSSLVLAIIFGLIWFLIKGNASGSLDSNDPASLIAWLAGINLSLFVFNLLPGFPLDGGRVLRALIWLRTGNYRQASRIASLIGRGIAILFIGGGLAITLYTVYRETDYSPFDGLWLMVIGWFLYNTANAAYRQIEMREALHGLTARAVMSTGYATVTPGISLSTLVKDYILPTRNQYFAVAWEGRFKGIITLDNIKAVPQSQWEITPVSAVMIPADKVVTAQPEEDALSLLDRMERDSIGAIPVIQDGTILGIIIRLNLLHFIRLRSEVKA